MSDIHLEPFAALIDWRMDDPISGEEWQNLLSTYLENLGKRGTQKPNTIIGHIKGITNLPEGDYMQVSVISPDRQATRSSRISGDFAASQLTFTLNFLVYGLSYQDASQIAQSSAAELAGKMGGRAVFTMLSDPDQIDHHHH